MDGTIYNATGQQMLKECEVIRVPQGRCTTGKLFSLEEDISSVLRYEYRIQILTLVYLFVRRRRKFGDE